MERSEQIRLTRFVGQFSAIAILTVVCITAGWIMLESGKDDGESVAGQIRALQAKQKFWESHRPASFRYVFQHRCFCGSELATPYLAIEEGGRRTAEFVGAVESGDLRSRPSQPMWVDDLFAIASDAVNADTNVRMSFDEEFGFPNFVHVNPGCLDCDDVYEVTNFVAME